ncbi:MAG: hypothetical protein H7101_06640 [Deinococcales bacterium]|nr:hypothetical protein [Chitinophagaceae bacterium]
MEVVFDFLAKNVIVILFIGLAILIFKIVLVYFLTASKSKKVIWSFHILQTNFFKSYTPEDIIKSKSGKRKTLKKCSNYIKSAFYVWLILLALALFFQYAESNSYDDLNPSENSTITPKNTE